MVLKPNEYPVKHKYIESKNGSMYLVKMVVRTSHIKDKEDLKVLSNEYADTHSIFKKIEDGEEYYYFCELIEDAIIIKE